MIGITNYSVYVPRRRMRRETIAAAWGTPAMPGCKAVMNFDEDSLTMAQAAVWPLAQSGAESLSFASTTAPYWQRSAASLIAVPAPMPRAAPVTIAILSDMGSPLIYLFICAGRAARPGRPSSVRGICCTYLVVRSRLFAG